MLGKCTILLDVSLILIRSLPTAEPFVEFLASLSSTPDGTVPKVFSISYADDENQVDRGYARRVSSEFQKAAARGVLRA